MGIYSKLIRAKQNYFWRKRNKHNSTRIASPTNIAQIFVDRYTYGMLNVLNEGNNHFLHIGSFCSIAPHVTFIVHSEHPTSFLSSFPFKVMILQSAPYEATSKGDIIIQDDVWIGYGSIILSGVKIGQGAVIAAGSVVTHNVPPYAIVAGVPARVIKYRFREEVIDFLLTLDYGRLTKDLIQDHIEDLYKPLEGLKVEEVKKLYEWFPKKGKQL